MQFTKAFEQAACIIILLATQESGEPLSTDEISRRLEVSPSYLKKITRKLVVKQIITSVSGNKGGISLARKTEEISVLDIIEAVEGPILIYPDTGLINLVFKGGKYVDKGSDIIRNVLKNADELLNRYFSNINVSDLLKEGFGKTEIPTLYWNKTSLTESLQQDRGEHD
ncbi:Rrf2 family transcriptional regulator [Bacillus sp. S3]|uniref:Rrf2 family transcriptional regulator n=1 Tax=Bacillus sp. S3 TaxID=486398 RepID=UPI00118B5A32|nr:Rrf2 family transcriptional regulator [Bacillus sp. S3]QCJ40603.1 Rrf2 family transcriptional regulator [Bacillus sp. S3]